MLQGETCIFLTVLNERDNRYLVLLKKSGEVVKRENVSFYGSNSIMNIQEDLTAFSLKEKDTNPNPKSIEKALNGPESQEWLNALQTEADNMKLHKTFQEIEDKIPEKILRSFIIFKNVQNNRRL